ncbi:SDR family oxidoreductase [Streptomyces sp. SID2999]|uniref:SDR family oxidoreductase n=1 Tax=Streptomyces sp. SID2999 TaxID=2690258 RepID=UPI0031BA0E1E
MRVNTVSPGPVHTEGTKAMLGGHAAMLDKATARGRAGDPGEIVSFLVSPASSYVNGAVLFAEGHTVTGRAPTEGAAATPASQGTARGGFTVARGRRPPAARPVRGRPGTERPSRAFVLSGEAAAAQWSRSRQALTSVRSPPQRVWKVPSRSVRW